MIERCAKCCGIAGGILVEKPGCFYFAAVRRSAVVETGADSNRYTLVLTHMIESVT